MTDKQLKKLIYHHRLWWQISEKYPRCFSSKMFVTNFNTSLSPLLTPIMMALQRNYFFSLAYDPSFKHSYWNYIKIETNAK